MADVKMSAHVPCDFDLGLDGKCGRPSGNGRCTPHDGIKCVSCGKQALRQCVHSATHPCPAPLCADCRHTEDGEHEPKPVSAGEGYLPGRRAAEAVSTP